jgi:hypothetical protein
MGALYNKMCRDLKLKNLAVKTQTEYLRCCTNFARYHMKSPAELGESAIKEYLAPFAAEGRRPRDTEDECGRTEVSVRRDVGQARR